MHFLDDLKITFQGSKLLMQLKCTNEVDRIDPLPLIGLMVDKTIETFKFILLKNSKVS